jgi:hypothetical protein
MALRTSSRSALGRLVSSGLKSSSCMCMQVPTTKGLRAPPRRQQLGLAQSVQRRASHTPVHGRQPPAGMPPTPALRSGDISATRENGSDIRRQRVVLEPSAEQPQAVSSGRHRIDGRRPAQGQPRPHRRCDSGRGIHLYGLAIARRKGRMAPRRPDEGSPPARRTGTRHKRPLPLRAGARQARARPSGSRRPGSSASSSGPPTGDQPANGSLVEDALVRCSHLFGDLGRAPGHRSHAAGLTRPAEASRHREPRAP